MEFKLTYHGELKSSGNSSNKGRNKHELRKAFHPQLKELWNRHPTLAGRLERTHISLQDAWDPDLVKAYDLGVFDTGTAQQSYQELLSAKFSRDGMTWLPLVAKDMGLHCSVDVLFLRSGDPGSIMKEGDLDGRLKTIFDALCIPNSTAGIDLKTSPNPMFCVLEDDLQIAKVSVETDELLERSTTTIKSESRLVISVKFKPAISNLATISWV